jgi:SDR family mycofactocin-dependent oxidoreductase
MEGLAVAGRLAGKVVFITGAGRGQGRSHAVRFAEEGADIIGVDICADKPNVPYGLASREDLDETARMVEKLDRRVVTYVADVADRRAMQEAIDAGVAALGRLDVVVANAGICSLGHYPIDAYFDAVDVDLIGVLNAVAVSYPHLSDGASIIAIGSTAGLIPGATDSPNAGPGGAGYSFAKRTIAAYTRDLALQLGPRSIRVNAIHPCNVNTPLLHNDPMYKIFRPDLDAPTREDALPAFPSMHAIPVPWVEPIDISNAALFLASDESRYVTGIQLRVDLGSVAKLVPGTL